MTFSILIIETLADLMFVDGTPRHTRSDNGPELAAKAVRVWLHRIESKTVFVELSRPWENAYCEPFNGKAELRNGEIFHSHVYGFTIFVTETLRFCRP